jgi:hypothetical protein
VMTESLEPHRDRRGVGDRHRFGSPGGSALAPGEASIYDRNHRDARSGRGSRPFTAAHLIVYVHGCRSADAYLFPQEACPRTTAI